MASHNSTPESVLNAPKATRALLEGTEFGGTNRAARRALTKTEPRILRAIAKSRRLAAVIVARKAARAERDRKRTARQARA